MSLPFDPTRFDAITFDCYGTLIDWETGLLAGLRDLLGPAASTLGDDALLEAYASMEAEAEAGPYRTYREILAIAGRGVATGLGINVRPDRVEPFGGSVVDWPAFSDSADALARLGTRFRLGVLTNCDDDLFAASNRRLGVSFDWVVTAQQVGSYKPDPRNFEALFDRVDLPRDRILHVAQSLYHDHAPAKALGLTTVWIDRRHDRAGTGATPPAQALPDARFLDMASFAAVAVP